MKVADTAMLTVTRRSFLSRDYEIREGIAPVGEFSLSRVGEHTELRVGLDLYEARRVGWINAGFVLKRHGREIAHAKPVGFFRSAFEILSDRFNGTLKPRGFLRRDYALFVGDTQVGSIKRVGFWGSSVEASFSPVVDRPIQLWVLWIATILWRRAAKAGAAS